MEIITAAISANGVTGRNDRDNAQAHSKTVNKGVSVFPELKSQFGGKRSIPQGLTHTKIKV